MSIIILHVVDRNFNQLFNFGDEMEINCLLAISNPFVSLASQGAHPPLGKYPKGLDQFIKKLI